MVNFEYGIAEQLPNAKVLIVDDQLLNITLLQKILAGHYQTSVAHSGEDALKMIEESAPDIILLDIEMAGINGIETCRVLKSRPETKNIPIIFITSFGQHEDLCWQVGGVDFISKPINPKTVFNRVTAQLTLKFQRDKLLELVFLDGLTDVYNRRYFDSHLTKTQLRAKREQGDYALVIIDIDFFKQFNDIYGHIEGDKVLQQVAHTIKTTLLRPCDFVARYGGEEFAVILPDTDLRGGALVAENILNNIAKLKISHNYSIYQYLTVSAGLATFKGLSANESIIKSADEKLYVSKQQGRNKLTF
ncbi:MULTISPECIES: GGDEF domain-containing response regulator [Pseudoalteromonas]|uniref:diguanylate cyclase n=1 Tax=Pseudoalteromonas haloplanktis TaxID=228 RepID=A0ABU1B7H4_PSEHA|nr:MULTISPECIES: diguanylate cyclase [Pseudoalteromonas]MCF6146244.1 hypothetical protein [Pseudoalteromonas mariniglutinosa NCIMB 1770]MDQ9090197.1 diguanylate cyclase [Pseudoalteromonas haloplanktis]